jgi:DVNP family
MGNVWSVRNFIDDYFYPEKSQAKDAEEVEDSLEIIAELRLLQEKVQDLKETMERHRGDSSSSSSSSSEDDEEATREPKKIGTKREVWHERALMTTGGLTKADLKIHLPSRRIVSIKASEAAKARFLAKQDALGKEEPDETEQIRK